MFLSVKSVPYNTFFSRDMIISSIKWSPDYDVLILIIFFSPFQLILSYCLTQFHGRFYPVYRILMTPQV